jgi:hypothetical protein
VGVAGRTPQQRLQQGRDEVGDLAEAVGDRAGDRDVGEQGHGQRVAAPEPHQLGADRRGDPGEGEQLVALGRVEVVETVDGDHRAPARVGTPGRCRGVAPGQDDQGVGEQGGQERLAQPAVDRAELLVAVDQQDGPGQAAGHGAVGRSAESGMDGVLEPLGRRVDLPGVEQHRRPAGVPGPDAELQ